MLESRYLGSILLPTTPHRVGQDVRMIKQASFEIVLL